MEIKDIIKTDYDRLFIVDPECYIIFTGDSTDDLQPFIRIGNWINLPVELIPLIENIIITDSLIGNPSHEQFNIDIRYLPTNRYIGSKNIIKRFLEFQKVFSLDLKNASIVNVEKDIPELSKEESISRKNQFIGVFYKDGNFKIVVDNKSIFDLKKVGEHPINFTKIHGKLSDQNRNNNRYKGSGIVVIGHNPMFYRKKSFYSYLMPHNYFKNFSDLNINPEWIKALFYPSPNLINISKLLKWKNVKQNKVSIFTNNKDISFVKKLFPAAIAKIDDFNGLNYKTESDVTFKNYHNSYNLKIRYSNIMPGSNEITIAFIKGAAGIKKILHDKLDALLINYSAYEDINLILKSSDIPIAIIDDGNNNISKLWETDKIILYPGIQYDFVKQNTLEDIHKISNIDTKIVSNNNLEVSDLENKYFSIFESEKNNFKKQKKLFNTLSLLRLHLQNTRDRKLSSKLKSISVKISKNIDLSLLFENISKFSIILVFHNNNIFQFITEHEYQNSEKFFDEINPLSEKENDNMKQVQLNYHNRILEDRKRLYALLDIFRMSSRHFNDNLNELNKLKIAIERRKKEFNKEKLSLESSGIRSKMANEDHIKESGYTGNKSSNDSDKSTVLSRMKSMPKSVKVGLSVLTIIITLVLIFLIQTGYKITGDDNTIIQSSEINKKFTELNRKHNINIKDSDIYQYANTVALNNGYHEISYAKHKNKNPNWIYPSNMFTMLDGQKVRVSEGDTLWNLSKNKLIEINIEFNRIFKEMDQAGKDEKEKLLKGIIKYTFTKEQKEIINNIIKEKPIGEKIKQ